MAKLSADAVTAVMKRVLFTDAELAAAGGGVPDGAVIVDGLVRKFGFHPARVAAEKPAIDSLLAELPDNFKLNGGGGWSFLNGCMDRDGQQWGEQRDVEALVCLGIGAGSASWVMKDMANVLPGGVPYFETHTV